MPAASLVDRNDLPLELRRALRPFATALRDAQRPSGYRLVYVQRARRGGASNDTFYSTTLLGRKPVRIAASKDPYACALVAAAVSLDPAIGADAAAWLRSLAPPHRMFAWLAAFTPAHFAALQARATHTARRSLERSPAFWMWRDAVRYTPGNSGARRVRDEWEARFGR